MQDKAKKVALQISLIYGLAGAVWILTSDWMVARLFPDTRNITHFQTYKGLGFILLTTLLLYLAIRWFLRQRDAEKTSRLSVEEALQTNEQILKRAQAIARLGSWTADLARETFVASPEAAAIVGWQPGEHRVEELFSIVHPDDRERVKAAWEALVTKGTPYDLEHRIVVLGRVCWVQVRAEAEPHRSNKPARVVGITQDITARKEAELALIKSEERYRNLTDSAADSFFVHDERGNFLDVNRRACESLGYNREELLSLNLTNVEMELDQPSLERILQQIKPGQARTMVGTHRRKNGSEFPVEVRLGSFQASGRVLYHSLVRDITDRKRAADALEMFRTLVDRVNDAIEVMDPETGRFLDINEKACLDLGYAREELLSLSYPDVDPETDLAGFKRNKERLWDSGALMLESVHRRKDGTIYPVEVSMKWVWLDRDYMVAVVRDISERRKNEAALRTSEQQYSSLVNNIDGIVWETDLVAGRFTFVSDQARRILGYPLESWLQEDHFWRNHLHPEDRDSVVAQAQTYISHIKNGAAFDIEYRMRAADGRVVWIHDFVSVVTAEGRPVKLRGVMVDVTDRKDAEAELRKREEHFRLLIENASDLITVINNAGVIRFQSPSVVRMLGYRPEEMAGHSVFEYLHTEDAPRIGPAIQRAIANPGLPVSVEYRFRHQDGSWRYIQSVGRSIPNEAEEGFIIVNSRDTTETRKLEEQFRQSQKMEAIGQLAGGVAHDLNNILTVVHMQLDLLKHGDPLTASQLESVVDIEKAGRRAADLTRQLLMFSRRQAALKGNLDLNAVVTNITKMLQRIVGEDVGMHISYAPLPLPVHADAGMLDQVLLNLAVNSRDAMPNGGRLIIETAVAEFDETTALQRPHARPGKFACLSVSDTGTGIPPEILPRIYEPFFTTKDVGKGTGLGLATVFGIVQQHHGWINVTSEVTKGTTFRIYLPLLATETDNSSDTQIIAELRGGNETILLVEDEQSLRVLVRNVLTRLGYRVLEATTGVTALEVWQEHRNEVRLLLTDLVLPDGMTGKALAEQLVAQNSRLKVIYTSGYSREIAGKDFPLQDGVNFLSKPFQAAKLAHTVRNNLDAA